MKVILVYWVFVQQQTKSFRYTKFSFFYLEFTDELNALASNVWKRARRQKILKTNNSHKTMYIRLLDAYV